MKIIVDIDGTICTQQKSGEYEKAQPIQSMIDRINKYYDEGHYVTYWTARGSASGMDHSVLTEKQLKVWGCKYHELKMNKPAYDLWIDDKSENPTK